MPQDEEYIRPSPIQNQDSPLVRSDTSSSNINQVQTPLTMSIQQENSPLADVPSHVPSPIADAQAPVINDEENDKLESDKKADFIKEHKEKYEKYREEKNEELQQEEANV